MRLWMVPLLGLLPAPAYAPLDWQPWAWVCLAPLIYWLSRDPGNSGGPGTWLGLGWGYGVANVALRYAWVPEALLEKGGLQPLPFLVLTTAGLALLACYPAVAIGLTRWGWCRWHISPAWSFPPLYMAQEALLEITPFGGAPWGSLAATQVQSGSARIVVPVLGGLGLVLLIALVNAAWAAVAEVIWRRSQQPGGGPGEEKGGLSPARIWALPLQIGVITAMMAWPATPSPLPMEIPTFPVLLVPGDRDLRDMGDSRRSVASARDFLGRTVSAAARPSGETEDTGKVAGTSRGKGALGPERGEAALALWPESAVSGRPQSGKLLADLFAAAQAMEIDLLFGANAAEGGGLFNAAFLVSGERFQTAFYAKQRLVPFGEYVPLPFRGLLGKKLSEGVQDYSPGGGDPVLDWRGTALGLSICFESVHPAHARAATKAGAVALVALSNDGWLSPSAAQHHLRLSALRGLETGRDVLFVANRGWSALLRDGQAQVLLMPGATARWVRAARQATVTPWVRFGPAAPLLAATAVLVIGFGFGRRRNGRK